MAKMTIREMLENMPRLERISSSDSICGSRGSSSDEREKKQAGKEKTQEWWAPGNEALMAKMTIREMLENMPRLDPCSSDSSSSEKAAKNRAAKGSKQEPGTLQKMSAAKSPRQHSSSASVLVSSARKPLKTSEKQKEPGTKQRPGRVRFKEPGKEQSQTGSKQQQQPAPAAPRAHQPSTQGRARQPSTAGQKLRMQLSRIWLRLKGCWILCCLCVCCLCLQRWAWKKQRVP